MTAMRFVDTNVLVYSVCPEPADAAKHVIATALLESTDMALSVQVFQEFYVQAVRPSRSRPLTHDQAVAFIAKWLRFPVQEMSVAILEAALATKIRWQVSYWDAAIIEAARALGCREILSEDLQDGCDYGGVHIVNPFAGAGPF